MLRECEYYRCWSDGTWDTYVIKIPEDAQDLDAAVRYAVEAEIDWKDEAPEFYGFYAWTDRYFEEEAYDADYSG